VRIDNLETYGWDSAIRGMRNPMLSHDRIDSKGENIGENDADLMKRLIKAGSSHRKFLRQIMVSMDITACLKFWDEFATYEFTVCNSTSQMHSMGKQLLGEEHFSSIDPTILQVVNAKITKWQEDRSEANFRDMIDNIPQSFLYTRTVTTNYEVVMNMIMSRRNHKMKEWRTLCLVLMAALPNIDWMLDNKEDRR